MFSKILWMVEKLDYFCINCKNFNNCLQLFNRLNEVSCHTDNNMKNLNSFNVPLLKNPDKNKTNFFSSTITVDCGFSWFSQQQCFAKGGGFLHCNQCTKTLHLSYQTPLYKDFHFSGWTFHFSGWTCLINATIAFSQVVVVLVVVLSPYYRFINAQYDLFNNWRTQ